MPISSGAASFDLNAINNVTTSTGIHIHIIGIFS